MSVSYISFNKNNKNKSLKIALKKEAKTSVLLLLNKSAYMD